MPLCHLQLCLSVVTLMYVLILVAFTWMTLIEMLTCLNKVFVIQHLTLFRACFEGGGGGVCSFGELSWV